MDDAIPGFVFTHPNVTQTVSVRTETLTPELSLFRQIVKELVLTQQLSQIELHDHIHSVLIEETRDQPMLHVATCGCYGGYGLDQLFLDFMVAHPAINQDSIPAHVQQNAALTIYHDRLLVFPYIEPFGRQCTESYPGIATALRLYKQHNLDAVFKHLGDLVRAMKNIADVEKVITLISDLDDSRENFGEDINTQTCILNKLIIKPDVYCKKYTKHSLIAMCNRVLSRETITADAARELILAHPSIDEDVLGLMVESHSDFEAKPCPNKKNMSFAYAVEYYNDSTTPGEIWKFQQHVNQYAMFFLMRHPNALSIQNEDLEIDIEIGILFASDFACKLQFQRVPPVLCWTIDEYDGLESICFIS